jgi:hypothetical protein
MSLFIHHITLDIFYCQASIQTIDHHQTQVIRPSLLHINH